jgi:hypothetical protein
MRIACPRTRAVWMRSAVIAPRQLSRCAMAARSASLSGRPLATATDSASPLGAAACPLGAAAGPLPPLPIEAEERAPEEGRAESGREGGTEAPAARWPTAGDALEGRAEWGAAAAECEEGGAALRGRSGWPMFADTPFIRSESADRISDRISSMSFVGGMSRPEATGLCDGAPVMYGFIINT